MQFSINGRKLVRLKGSQEEKKERKETEKGKGEKGNKEKKEREREEERERERGRKGSRRFDRWNLLDQGVKSGDSTRGYALRDRGSSYFGLLLAFEQLFWADFGTML